MPEKDITGWMWVAGSFIALWNFCLTTILGYHVRLMSNLREDIKEKVLRSECAGLRTSQESRLERMENGIDNIQSLLMKHFQDK